ncbi:MAG: DUF4340 domain-containing protein [Planctomycetia bacterium]|nr:DUF4340 domain-containing protein [Planctomycetia bacterium]
MNEIKKTLIFVFVALVLVVSAFIVTRPVKQDYTPNVMIGKELFPQLTDALSVNSLQIIRYDKNKGTIIPFEVRQVNHRWILPSHQNYPADAKDQVVRAATSLMGLQVISVVSENVSTHSDFGVLAPDQDALRSGAVGVGERIIMKDEKGNVLMDMIVGKEVDLQQGKRYVRRTGQDPVYTVELDTKQLSSDFSDWIQRDLMQIQPWDIKALNALDYSLDVSTQQLSWEGIIKLEYDDMSDPAWTLISNEIPGPSGEMRNRGIPSGKRLDTEKLDDCRNALADMRIVNVVRKPEGLSSQLKITGNYEFNEEDMNSLREKGFYLLSFPTAGGGTEMALLSNEGEITVTTKMGIRYVLRFGNVAGTGDISTESDAPFGLNRYLFIVAELDTDSIPEPHLHDLPEIPENVSDTQRAQLEAQRQAVQSMNQEETERYETAVSEAKTRADLLNERFAQWYYVIPESVYQEIRLSHHSIFTDDTGEEGHVCDENCTHAHHDHASGTSESKKEKSGAGNQEAEGVSGSGVILPEEKTPEAEGRTESGMHAEEGESVREAGHVCDENCTHAHHDHASGTGESKKEKSGVKNLEAEGVPGSGVILPGEKTPEAEGRTESGTHAEEGESVISEEISVSGAPVSEKKMTEQGSPVSGGILQELFQDAANTSVTEMIERHSASASEDAEEQREGTHSEKTGE